MVHMLPIIATKGGRGAKGKLLACPLYKTMNTETAYRLSALDGRGSEQATAHSVLLEKALRRSGALFKKALRHSETLLKKALRHSETLFKKASRQFQTVFQSVHGASAWLS